jgi:hypothetical protein
VATASTNKSLTFWAKRLISGIGDGRVVNQSPTFFYSYTGRWERVRTKKMRSHTLHWDEATINPLPNIDDVKDVAWISSRNHSKLIITNPKKRPAPQKWIDPVILGAKFLGGVEAQAVPEVQKFILWMVKKNPAPVLVDGLSHYNPIIIPLFIVLCGYP